MVPADDNAEDDPDGDPALEPFDREAIAHDIAVGAKAGHELLRNVDADWTRWSALIRGLRGLRTLAFAKAHTSNMQSQAYREAMGSLLRQRQHAIYDQLATKQTRSACYALMDRLEDVDTWYAALPAETKLEWKHPKTVVKHCPREYLAGMRKHNVPPRKARRKSSADLEIELGQLRKLVMWLIGKLMKYEPEAAKHALNMVHPADPEDEIPDFAGEDELQEEPRSG